MWPLSTVGDPLPFAVALAGAAIILVCWLLARTIPRLNTTSRATAIVVCLLVIGLVAFCLGTARAYPGPAWRHASGTAIHWMHVHVLPWGSYLALLTPPTAAILVSALWPQGGRRTTMVAVVLSVLLLVPSLVLGLAIVCNYPGACP